MTFKDLKREIPHLLTLAIPVVLTQLGQMMMGLVDTFMVGKLGPEAIGAVGLSNAFFHGVILFGLGILFSLDYFVSTSFGRKDIKGCSEWLIQGIWLAVILSVFLSIGLYFAANGFTAFGIQEGIAKLAASNLRMTVWGTLPFLVFVSCRQYLQAMNHVKFVMLLFIVANFLNAFLNWLFIYGNWGAPALGVDGSALATVISRYAWLFATLGYIYYWNKKENWHFGQISARLHLGKFYEILKIGIPTGALMFFEVASFALCTTLAGKLGVIPLASHHIVLNIASFTFMVPLGISAATSVRVGQAIGEENANRMRAAGWAGFLLSGIFMVISGFTLFIFGEQIIGLFSPAPEVVQLAKVLLLYAAFFQIADGIQVTGTGALRGLSNTKVSMLANFFGYWFFGIPLGIWLAFNKNWGVQGLWLGLTSALIVVAFALVYGWHKHSKSIAFAPRHSSVSS